MTRSSPRLLLALGAALALACSEAPTAHVARPATPAAPTLIRDVAVVDVESGVRVPGRDVLLRDGRIAAIEPNGAIEAAGATLVDGSGASLVPGLIDMHGHVNTSTGPSWEFALPDPEANLRSYLYAGVTTVFDPGDASEEAFARRERVAQGQLVGPRIFGAGPVITCPGGHPVALVREFAPAWIHWYLEPRIAVQVEGEAAVAAAVDDVAARGADAVKVAVDRIPLDAPRIPMETLRAVVERARSHRLRVVAHIGSTRDALDAAEAGVALWVHGVYQDRIPEDQVAKLASYGIPMVATIEVFDRYARAGEGPIAPIRIEHETVTPRVLASFFPIPDDFDLGGFGPWLEQLREGRGQLADNVMRLRRAGVTILAGSDTQSGVFPGAGLHRELAQLVKAGMSPAEALRAATLDAATWLAEGRPPQIGAVRVGMRADLLLVEGDPLRDVARLQDLREVFVAGSAIERRPLAPAR